MNRFRDLNLNYKKPDCVYKILVVGDGTCGKSSILHRYVDSTFYPNYISTIGVDFKIKCIEVDNKNVKLQMWDTAGQERFRSITSVYYRGVNGILLVYDVSNRESFTNIKEWIKNIDMFAPNDAYIILVGNKSDTTHRKVKIDEGIELAKELNIPFIETSAKDNINIDKAFELIVEKLNNKFFDPLLTIPNAPSEIVKIDEKNFIRKWCGI